MIRDYQELIERIQQLSTEQQQLYRIAGERELTAAELQALQKIRTQLPKLWLERKRGRTGLRDPLESLILRAHNLGT